MYITLLCVSSVKRRSLEFRECAGQPKAHRSLQPALCQPAHVPEVAPGCTGKASITDLTGRHRCVLRRLAQHDRRLDISEGGDIGPDFSHAWIIESSLQGLW